MHFLGILYRRNSNTKHKGPHNAVLHHPKKLWLHCQTTLGACKRITRSLHRSPYAAMGSSFQRNSIQRRVSTNKGFHPISTFTITYNLRHLQVHDQEQFDHILLSFPWDGDLPDDVKFPYSFPFSSMVPKVYQQVKEFIYACLKFSEDLNLR